MISLRVLMEKYRGGPGELHCVIREVRQGGAGHV